MKPKTYFTDPINERGEEQKEINIIKYGITRTLLEKYKPSKRVAILASSEQESDGRLAA